MENNETGLNTITDTIENVITGVPAPVRKNFIKAFGQLCTAAVDIPVAWLEGKSAEIRTTTEARLQIIRKEGNVISEQIEVPKEYITKASSKFAAKVIKEQLNLDQITLNAVMIKKPKTFPKTG
jgi:predicted transcriptional regulator